MLSSKNKQQQADVMQIYCNKMTKVDWNSRELSVTFRICYRLKFCCVIKGSLLWVNL